MGKFRSSYAWKKKRAEIVEQYNHRCAICDAEAHEVHHIIPIAVLDELKLDNQNLILLCERCHKLAHLGVISQAHLLKRAQK